MRETLRKWDKSLKRLRNGKGRGGDRTLLKVRPGALLGPSSDQVPVLRRRGFDRRNQYPDADLVGNQIAEPASIRG